MDTLGRLVSSKASSYFWIAFTLVFAVFDFLVGSPVFGALMVGLFVFYVWDYSLKIRGIHPAYNRYHGVGK